MSLQFDGLNINEMQFDGLNIAEAMYNGQIVWKRKNETIWSDDFAGPNLNSRWTLLEEASVFAPPGLSIGVTGPLVSDNFEITAELPYYGNYTLAIFDGNMETPTGFGFFGSNASGYYIHDMTATTGWFTPVDLPGEITLRRQNGRWSLFSNGTVVTGYDMMVEDPPAKRISGIEYDLPSDCVLLVSGDPEYPIQSITYRELEPIVYPLSGSWEAKDTSGTELADGHLIAEDGMYKVRHTVLGAGNYRSLIASFTESLKSTSSVGSGSAVSEYIGGFSAGDGVQFGTEVLGAAGTTLNLSGNWNIEKIAANEVLTGSYTYQKIPQTTDAQNPDYLIFIDYLVSEDGNYRFQISDTTPSANFIIGIMKNGATVESGTTSPITLDKTLSLVAGDKVQIGAVAFVNNAYIHGGNWTVTPL